MIADEPVATVTESSLAESPSVVTKPDVSSTLNISPTSIAETTLQTVEDGSVTKLIEYEDYDKNVYDDDLTANLTSTPNVCKCSQIDCICSNTPVAETVEFEGYSDNVIVTTTFNATFKLSKDVILTHASNESLYIMTIIDKDRNIFILKLL